MIFTPFLCSEALAKRAIFQVGAAAGIFICLRGWVLWDLKPVKTFFNQNTSLTLCLSFQLQILTNPLQKELAWQIKNRRSCTHLLMPIYWQSDFNDLCKKKFKERQISHFKSRVADVWYRPNRCIIWNIESSTIFSIGYVSFALLEFVSFIFLVLTLFIGNLQAEKV